MRWRQSVQKLQKSQMQDISQPTIDLTTDSCQVSTDMGTDNLLAMLEDIRHSDTPQIEVRTKKVSFLCELTEKSLTEAFKSFPTVTSYLHQQAAAGSDKPKPSKLVSGVMLQRMKEMLFKPSEPQFTDISKVRLLATIMKSPLWRPLFKALAEEHVVEIRKALCVLRNAKVAIFEHMKTNWLKEYAQFLSKGRGPAKINEESLQVAMTADGIFSPLGLNCYNPKYRAQLVDDLEQMVDEIFKLMRFFSQQNLSQSEAGQQIEPLTINEHLLLCCLAVCIKERYDTYVVKMANMSGVAMSLQTKVADTPQKPDPSTVTQPTSTAKPCNPSKPSAVVTSITFDGQQSATEAIQRLRQHLVELRTHRRPHLFDKAVNDFLACYTDSVSRLEWIKTILADKQLHNILNSVRQECAVLMPSIVTKNLTKAEAQLEATYVELLAKYSNISNAYSVYMKLKLEQWVGGEFTSAVANDLAHYFKTLQMEFSPNDQLRLTDKLVVELLSNFKVLGRAVFVVLSLMFPKLFISIEKEDLNKIRETCVGQTLQHKKLKTSTQVKSANLVSSTLFKYQLDIQPKQILEHLDFLDCWLSVVFKMDGMVETLLPLVNMSADLSTCLKAKPIELRESMIQFITRNGANILPYGSCKQIEEINNKIQHLDRLQAAYNIGFSYTQKEILVVDAKKKEDLCLSIKSKALLMEKMTQELENELALWQSINKAQPISHNEKALLLQFKERVNILQEVVVQSSAFLEANGAVKPHHNATFPTHRTQEEPLHNSKHKLMLERLSKRTRAVQQSTKPTPVQSKIKLMACNKYKKVPVKTPELSPRQDSISTDILSTSMPIVTLLN